MKCLVIGGNGFLGYGVVDYLSKENLEVVCFSKDECRREERLPNVKYVIGDVWDEGLLLSNLKGTDVVLDFLSTTLPNNSNIYLDDEVNRTLRYHNYIMSMIHKAGVKHYVFPSSGGAIYGNTDGDLVDESKTLQPCTPYGVGKKMVEDMLRYFNSKFSIAVTILRIGNIYGSKLNRDKPQGVVDILIQKAINGDSFTVWGNALESKRDYVFLEDVGEAVYLSITKYHEGELRIFNVGSSKAKSVKEIIDIIEKESHRKLNIIFDKNQTSGVNQIVLSTEKINRCIGWKAKTSLEEGIRKTIAYKEKVLERK